MSTLMPLQKNISPYKLTGSAVVDVILSRYWDRISASVKICHTHPTPHTRRIRHIRPEAAGAERGAVAPPVCRPPRQGVTPQPPRRPTTTRRSNRTTTRSHPTSTSTRPLS